MVAYSQWLCYFFEGLFLPLALLFTNVWKRCSPSKAYLCVGVFPYEPACQTYAISEVNTLSRRPLFTDLLPSRSQDVKRRSILTASSVDIYDSHCSLKVFITLANGLLEAVSFDLLASSRCSLHRQSYQSVASTRIGNHSHIGLRNDLFTHGTNRYYRECTE